MRKVYAWLAIALILSLVSSCMVAQITHVDGHSPFDILNPKFGRDKSGDYLKEAAHGQLISVLYPLTDPGSPTIEVDYFTRGYGDTDIRDRKEAAILFKIPANQSLIIILNNVSDRTKGYQCHSAGQKPENTTDIYADEPGSLYFNMHERMVGKRALYDIHLPAESETYSVKCWLQPDVELETFTKRSLDFAFFGPGTPFSYRPGTDDEVFVAGKGEFDGFITVERIALTVEIKGADGISFEGGKLSPESENYDLTRILERYKYLSVGWDDVFRSQLRDVLLIVIGTLIAIAVTALIEAVRPFVEGQLQVSDLFKGLKAKPSSEAIEPPKEEGS